MKLKMIAFASALVLATSTAALAADVDVAANPKQQNTATENAKDTKSGEILAWIMQVDKSEIAAAKIALKKKVSAPVKQFAQMMIKQHGKNLVEAKKLSHHVKPVDSSTTASLKSDSEKEAKKLQEATTDFDKEYITAMVDGHTNALKQIDDYLQAGIQNPKMEKFAKETKEMISHHLDEAKKVQDNMKS